MNVAAIILAWLIVCGAFFVASHEGLIDTAVARDALRDAARVSARALGE